MKLWILKAKNESSVAYDNFDGFVIRAENSRKARLVASAKAGGSESDIWLHPRMSSCKELSPSGKSSIVFESFKAG
jgi:hypothetical protein